MSSMLLMLSMIYLGHSPIFKQESLKMNIGDMVSAFYFTWAWWNRDTDRGYPGGCRLFLSDTLDHGWWQVGR